MGTDIRGVFQRYDEGTRQWRDVPSNFDQGRDYQLFAVLAGVRNGHGFAGITIGEVVTPIAAPRGLPDAFEPDEPLESWMGGHSYSWLSGEEMLAWAAMAPEVVKTGVLDRDVYEAWDGKSRPPRYCSGISGRDVILVNDNAMERRLTPNWTHIRCDWQSDLCAELDYFFSEVARLVAEHGRIRFVFCFD